MRVKTAIAAAVLCLTLSLVSTAQSTAQNQGVTLESVLKKMDAAAATFQSAEADFEWVQYQKVVDEKDTQTGTVYYRKSGTGIEMMADIKTPDRKFVLYKEGKLQVYQPKIEQVMQFTAGANQNEMEGYLVLGFGGSGQDLIRAYDVTFLGEETIDKVATAKLQLVPKNEKVKNYFSQATLWIDVNRGISLQQQFMQGQGDYRLARYSAIRMPAKLGNDVFQLKTTKRTQFVSPRG
ncbi:MAG: outer membrane lipoprotein-sorting protein [Candidatus Sulfotelmatobacter sp.]